MQAFLVPGKQKRLIQESRKQVKRVATAQLADYGLISHELPGWDKNLFPDSF
jgi:hypothetical protein